MAVNDPRTYAILRALLEVHHELGNGFLERAYHLAAIRELSARNIPVASEVELPIWYKGEPLSCTYRVDLLCYDDVLVELKAVERLTVVEAAQAVNDLKASGLPVILLVNFGGPSLEWRRFEPRVKLPTQADQATHGPVGPQVPVSQQG